MVSPIKRIYFKVWIFFNYNFEFALGISVDCNGRNLICCAICLLGATDLPGKSAVQAFTQFNGKCGCSFCEQKGEVVSVGKGHSRCYPYTAGPPNNLRNSKKVFTQAQQAGLAVSHGYNLFSRLDDVRVNNEIQNLTQVSI